MTEPTWLRVLGMREPRCVETTPTLSWVPASAAQEAYQVQVGTHRGGADVWDSGEVESRQSVEVAYAGPPLRSAACYHWQARPHP